MIERYQQLLGEAHLAGGEKVVGLGGHDEIIAMESMDRMRPPRHGGLAPLGQDGGVMIFLIGNLADRHAEIQCRSPSLDAIHAFEAALTVDVDELPIRYPSEEVTLFGSGNPRRIDVAGYAAFGRERHGRMLVSQREMVGTIGPTSLADAPGNAAEADMAANVVPAFSAGRAPLVET